MRLLGATLLMTASALLGWAMGRWYTQRARQLRDIVLALQVLETEIAFGAWHLAEALQRAAAPVDPPVKDLFLHAARKLTEDPSCSGPAAWEEALDVVSPVLALTRDERASLRGVGVRLGASDGDDQVRHLRAAWHILGRHAERAEAQRDQGERLWRYLGVSTGLIVVLLLY